MIITEGGPESGREVSAATTLQGSSIALFKGGEGEMVIVSLQSHKAGQRKVDLELRDNQLIIGTPICPAPNFYNC